MRITRNCWPAGLVFALGAFLTAAGCYHTPVDTSALERGPAPLRIPSPAAECRCQCECYEDSLTGGQVFDMYCSYCHNAPSLAERPFSQFRNVAAHMRVRANLTGKEYAKLMEFLRRWNDIPPPTPAPAPSPTKLTFSQPLSELKPAEPTPAPPKPDAAKPEAIPAPPKPAGPEEQQDAGPQP